MSAFMAGLRNERLAVQGDNATSRAIITQVCGWDEGSKTASASGMPLPRCWPGCQKITGFISGRIKCGLRINEFLNTQHHLHKKQQAGYVGGPVYLGLNALSEWDARSEKVWRTQTMQSKSPFQVGFIKACRDVKANPAVETFLFFPPSVSGAGAGVYW